MRIPKNGKDYARLQVVEDDGGTVTISNQVFDVVDDTDTVIQAESNASLRNNGTAAVEVYGLVDTTAAAFTDQEWVKARFTFNIGDVLLKRNVPILLAEVKL